jgi:hypothetical protein
LLERCKLSIVQINPEVPWWQQKETLEKVVLWISSSDACSVDGSGKAFFSLVDPLDFIVTVNKGIEPPDCWIFLPRTVTWFLLV